MLDVARKNHLALFSRGANDSLNFFTDAGAHQQEPHAGIPLAEM